jgi:hypothetical protein
MRSQIFELWGSAVPANKLEAISEQEEAKVHKMLSVFECFESYTPAFLTDVVKIKDSFDLYLCLLSLNFEFKGRKTPQNITTTTEQELIGLAVLHKKYGHVYIRPETLGDKLQELFVKNEIDFEADKEFSRKYYVVADNEMRCRMNLSSGFLSIVKPYNGLEIEINDTILIARFRKPFTKETGEELLQLLDGIGRGGF